MMFLLICCRDFRLLLVKRFFEMNNGKAPVEYARGAGGEDRALLPAIF
jgi:hypothetical protein